MSQIHCYTLRVAVTALLIAFGAHPALSAPEGSIRFDIPAQSLNRALLAFGKQSGRQLLYSTGLADHLTSGRLKGNYTVDEAIPILLGDAPVEAVAANGGAISLKKKPPASPDSKAPADPRALAKVTVSAEAEYDANDPYNNDYAVTNASTATKTDTPVMETPANIQVVPKAVLDDQQALNLTQAFRNVSGAFTNQGSGGLNDQIFLRGFQNPQQFRNGFRFNSRGSSVGTRQMANVERIEVLKGSGSALYGQSWEPSMVNVVTKQPLTTPYYSLQQQFGSFDLYRTSVDATGPLTSDDTLLYRFNASFEDSGSFRELVDSERIFLAPIVKWNISPRTQATLEMEYRHDNLVYDAQVRPFVNGRFIDIPISRNLSERTPNKVEDIFIGFNWSHQFNDDWKLSQQFATDLLDRPEFLFGLGSGATLTNGNMLNRTVGDFRSKLNSYFTDINLTGHFDTIGLKHTLLLGGDYYRWDVFSIVLIARRYPVSMFSTQCIRE